MKRTKNLLDDHDLYVIGAEEAMTWCVEECCLSAVVIQLIWV